MLIIHKISEIKSVASKLSIEDVAMLHLEIVYMTGNIYYIPPTLLSHSCCLHTTSLHPWEMNESEYTYFI